MSSDRHCGQGPAFWRNASLPLKIFVVAGIVIAFAAVIALVGYVFMALWNWLMPSIFGLRPIRYWEGWGLMILASILFKKNPSGKHLSEERHKRHLRERMREASERAAAGENSGSPRTGESVAGEES